MKSQSFFETIWGLEADGKVNENWVPNLLQMAVILNEYSNEFRLTQPPQWIQRPLFGLLSFFGKILGYRASYPQYAQDSVIQTDHPG